MASPFTVRAVALLALSSSIACGGMVVFEEPGEGGGGGSPAGNGGASAVDAVAIASTGTVDPSTDVSISAVSVTSGPGGGDGGAPSGPVGPGPGPGGGDPTGGGAPPGPSGVGGADVGNAQGGAVTTAAGGCGVFQETTNQYCYAVEACPEHRLELECETNGDGPWTCWCYQDGQYRGSCTEGDFPSCSTDGCCESYWVLPG